MRKTGLETLDRIKAKTQLLFAQAQERQAKYANAKRRDIEFQEGDFVMINSDFIYDPIHTDRPTRKLANKWLGPFRVDGKQNIKSCIQIIYSERRQHKSSPGYTHSQLEEI